MTAGSELIRLQPGALVEPVGEVWAAFSPASGETLLLNAEAAAILEVLAEGPRSLDALCRSLAEVAAALDASLVQLRGAGLIRTA